MEGTLSVHRKEYQKASWLPWGLVQDPVALLGGGKGGLAISGVIPGWLTPPGAVGSQFFPWKSLWFPGSARSQERANRVPTLCFLPDLLRDDDAVCVPHAGPPPAW